MKEVLQRASACLEPLGYQRRQRAFFRVDAGVYWLIDFQSGAHGGGYFFVNLGIHPLGLPKLYTKRLVIPKAPGEHECIIRQRVEQVVPRERLALNSASFRPDDNLVMSALFAALGTDVQAWFHAWGNCARLVSAPEDEILRMLTVVPKLKRKALFMLRFFCLLRSSDSGGAASALRQYLTVTFEDLDFSHVDHYLESLLPPNSKSGTVH